MTPVRTATAGDLGKALDKDGCAFGQVTRERVDNLSVQLQHLQATLNSVALAVGIQLLTIIVTLVMFTFGRLH